MSDDTLVLGLLNVLEREVLPAIECGAVHDWGKANRLADAVLALIPEEVRRELDLPGRVGSLQALYAAARQTRPDIPARACALYTFIVRAKTAATPRASRPPSSRPVLHSLIPAPDRNLPDWVPETGVLGGFRLIRPMASGGLGSLFLARRVEDGTDPHAPDVVLKVPHDPSELAPNNVAPPGEMLSAFRTEASALAAIPLHDNLARILAFDVAATPRPFLVMELVDGPTLEAQIEVGAMTMTRALDILDGVLAGLDAMHATGVGHLDVKPDNVILRRQTGAATLVDFGLSGRGVRKQCGNPTYAAPEIWNDDRDAESPFAADAYSFACVAFETLTSRPLFDGDDIFHTIRLHMLHDGWPPSLSALRARPELRKLAEILSRALRANPSNRTRIRMLRTELARVAPSLRDLEWPLRVPEVSTVSDVSELGGTAATLSRTA